jgi:hypothetical protein
MPRGRIGSCGSALGSDQIGLSVHDVVAEQAMQAMAEASLSLDGCMTDNNNRIKSVHWCLACRAIACRVRSSQSAAISAAVHANKQQRTKWCGVTAS